MVQVSDCRGHSPREAVLTKPQTRKATAITAVTPKTTLSRLPLEAARSSTSTSRAGWDPSDWSPARVRGVVVGSMTESERCGGDPAVSSRLWAPRDASS